MTPFTMPSVCAHYAMPSCCSRCLAEEAPESWPVRAETRAPQPNEENTTIITCYWTEVPICKKCHGELSRLCYLFWFVGVMGGAAAVALLALYLPRPVVASDTPLGIEVAVAIAVAALVAWGIAAACRFLLDASVASYDPHQSRLKFGNRRYQALFDQLNCYLPKGRRSSLGV